jgi:hypothetical protein
MHPKKRRSEDRITLYPTLVPAVSLGLLMLFVAAAIRGGVRVSRSSSS